jgi:hypothetical protein
LQLQNFTIEAWIKRSSASIVTNSADGVNPGGIFLAYGNGGYGFFIDQPTNRLGLTHIGFSAAFSTATITDTNFHHVAVTKNGGTVTFYIDGVASAPVSYNPTFTFTTNVAIGGRGDGNIANHFFGNIDELSIYNRELSQAEIQSITAAETAGKCLINISGIVSYAITPAEQTAKFVPSVTLTAASGASSESALTTLAGAYSLNNLIADGNYTVTPTKTADINGITPFDATLVLRCVAAGASCALTQNQQLAGDTNNSNSITPFDATLILRFVAANGQTAATGQTGNWRFKPPTRSYSAVNGRILSENYEAILIGEVNGSWTPPNSLPQPEAVMTEDEQSFHETQSLFDVSSLPTAIHSEAAPQISLTIERAAIADDIVVIPVRLDNPESLASISGYSFTLEFDLNVLQPLNANAIETVGTLSSNLSIVAETVSPGIIRIAAAGTGTGISASGILLNLRFKAVGKNKLRETATFLSIQAPVFEDKNGERLESLRANDSFFIASEQ